MLGRARKPFCLSVPWWHWQNGGACARLRCFPAVEVDVFRRDEISTRYLWTRDYDILRQSKISTSYPRQDIISIRYLVLPIGLLHFIVPLQKVEHQNNVNALKHLLFLQIFLPLPLFVPTSVDFNGCGWKLHLLDAHELTLHRLKGWKDFCQNFSLLVSRFSEHFLTIHNVILTISAFP